jgi:rod shape-determining protein MreD
MYRSRAQALFVGCITGVMLDAVLGWPLGYNGFGKTIAAFVIGQTSRRVNVGETWICFVLMASSSCLSSLSIFLLFWLMQRKSGGIFLGASVVQALITAGVGVLLFAILETYTQAQARKAS